MNDGITNSTARPKIPRSIMREMNIELNLENRHAKIVLTQKNWKRKTKQNKIKDFTWESFGSIRAAFLKVSMALSIWPSWEYMCPTAFKEGGKKRLITCIAYISSKRGK